MTTLAERDSHAATFRNALATLRGLDRLDANGVFASRRLEAHREIAHAVLRHAADQYEASLMPVPISRCPHTDAVLAPHLDVVGLDGPWWNHDIPRRPLPAGLPGTLVGIDGTIRLQGVPPRLPFTVGLGPEAPCVLPRLLGEDGVVAVISRLDIGPHLGFVTAYFVAPDAAAPTPIADWGTDHYLGIGDDGAPLPVYPDPEGRDPELRPWLASDRLQWIAPGDASLRLRTGVEGCPYLGLGGDASLRWLVDGKIIREMVAPPEGDRP
ncbi:MAG: hypothetical protein WD652_06110 [Acidimicrobiia bacterium]